jgi:hypothetical protein
MTRRPGNRPTRMHNPPEISARCHLWARQCRYGTAWASATLQPYLSANRVHDPA